MKFSLFSLFCFSNDFRKKSRRSAVLQWLESVTSKHPKCSASALPEGICREISLAQIKVATNNFHKDLIIGQGGFGTIYRGTFDGGIVAVLRNRSHQGFEEFKTEVLFLCQLRHPNLVSLIGICIDQEELILVYEYVSRGSLSDHLYGNNYAPLNWKQRLEICIATACALHYLHSGAKRFVIHRDIQSSNILLDDECSPKLSDFGLSIMGPLSTSKASIKREESKIIGTYGYMAPEYAMLGELTNKSDVYSFGVLLFEVLSGRRPDIDLLQWASELGKEGKISHVIDPYLKGNIAPECFNKYLEIARDCVHNEGNERPTMGEVEVTLELVLEMQKKADSKMEGNRNCSSC